MKENFKIYNFFDTDDTGFEEYDIVGEEYELLIKTCCKYCDVVSFTITNPNSKVLIELEEFKINKPDNISDDILHEYICGTEHSYFNYYRVCDKLCDILLKTTNNIFSWITGWGYKNPNDPTFYREDGSVFFTSTIHDGECTLFVRDEDVSEILANKLWIKGTGHGNRYTVEFE